MMRLVLVFWILAVGTGLAAPVIVKSGDHDGFTRLVLDYGGAVDWQMGRTGDGYELVVKDQAPVYDVTRVFQFIGKGRLAAVWADPVTHALHIGIACACYAIPFEFRPGIVVIDLRNGAPPSGSSFELAIDGSSAPQIASKAVPKPRPRPRYAPISVAELPQYDWIKSAAKTLQVNTTRVEGTVGVLPSVDPALQSLRETMLRQLSRGAAQGVVEFAPIAANRKPYFTQSSRLPPSARVSLGELPGVSLGSGLPDHSELAATGEVCISAADLSIAEWGDDRPIKDQMAEAMADLIGEFDRPDQLAVEKAVKFELFLGFGAESRQLAQAFKVDQAANPALQSLSYIMDGEFDPVPAFSGQTACDSPAALWAMLTMPSPDVGAKVNREAVFLAFSDLPIALRRHLGPVLADRFLALNDPQAARTLRDAILRAPGEAGPEVALLQAKLNLKNGDAEAAEQQLVELIADPGPGTLAALIELVDARIAQDLPIETAIVVALEGMLPEQSGAKSDASLQRAVILASAASGDFDRAFQGLSKVPDLNDVTLKVWRILAMIGQNQALLAYAVMPKGQELPRVDAETAHKVTERLLALGMDEDALRWLGQSSPDALLFAQVYLQRNDPQAALLALADEIAVEALPLRARAISALGDASSAAVIYAKAGDQGSELRALRIAKDWATIGERAPDPWQTVAVRLGRGPQTPEVAAGPLATGHSLVEQSSVTRKDVTALLASVALP